MGAHRKDDHEGAGRVSEFLRGALGLKDSSDSSASQCPRCGYPLTRIGEMKAGDRKLFRMELCGLVEGGRSLLQPVRIQTHGEPD